MNRKILFLDLDGTLLNSRREISKGNRAALEKALTLGHRVVINTGRPLKSALIQNRRLGLTMDGCYLIAFNGGILYDSYREEILYRQCLSMDTALAVSDLCSRRGLHVQTYDREQVLIEPRWEDEAVRRYCEKILMDYRVVPDFATGLTEAPPKVLAISYTDRPALEALQTEILAAFPEVDCFFSCQEYLEVVPRGVHKGSAIKMLCRRLGMDVADSIAAGDAENDLQMLRSAGLGCAMANAVEAVKQAAGYVTTRDNDHDGVAEIVDRFLLEEG